MSSLKSYAVFSQVSVCSLIVSLDSHGKEMQYMSGIGIWV